MKKISVLFQLLFCLNVVFAQKPATPLNPKYAYRCLTMERMNEAIQKDPTLPLKWKIEGEKQYQSYLLRKANQKETKTEAGEIIIPVVFHIVDTAAAQAWITDRDVYEQVELLNKAYSGQKADFYKKVIPAEIYNRLGRVNVKFVLARRSPTGALTSGIERRVNVSPDHVKIKSTASGGLDAWDVTKYVNVWAGTFTGGDDGLLGIATFPFTTIDEEGPQGVVISIATLPYTSNVSRSYYPAYSEGATLAHEIGHYFYLWHTFGDDSVCNNNDFRIQPGWPLPNGAGPEGDDTPEEKYDKNGPSFGNPSMNYSDGCTSLPFGEMYGSFMNYFDDRALFMFSDGMRKRVEGCINLYRPGLLTTNGATPPVAVTDAFLVTVTPRGIPERREYLVNNSPLTATVRNSGTNLLTSVTLNVALDAGAAVATTFPLSLPAGADTVLNLGAISGATGTHVLTIYTSRPNNAVDMFTNNDTIQSFVYVNNTVLTAPFIENFTGTTFPPAGWQIWNPNANTTWIKSTTSGFNLPGSATVQNSTYNGPGQLDDLISPPIDLGTADSSLLSFKVAYAVYDSIDVSTWDGLEVYVSSNGGVSYQLIYKKTGKYLKTVPLPQTTSFSALPGNPEKWRLESINLTPYIIPGKKLLLKFRNTNANGNNLYLDDINVSASTLYNRDVFPVSIANLPSVLCGDVPSPSLIFQNGGTDPLTSVKINYQLDNGSLVTSLWTGNLLGGQTATVAFPALTSLAVGSHIFKVYTSAPNGLTDQNPLNDTISKTFYVFGKVSLPVTEGFEGVTFPPANWGIDNPSNGITWERTTVASKTGVASMVIRNYDNTVNSTSKFISSVITNTAGNDSLFVSFDYAYAQGVSGVNPDTLDLQVTTDCGKTYTSVWKKWGPDLQTLANPNNANGSSFIPGSGDWTNAKVDLSQYAGRDFQVSFTSKGNRQNNLYIDNINIYGVIVPALLKKQGYLIYPSPFSHQFIIRNYEVPVTFLSASVYNSVGQLIWTKNFNGTAFREETVDLGNAAKGIYFVKLNYTNKTVVVRVLKD